jgi:type II secretory pathway pseudopilin PulG
MNKFSSRKGFTLIEITLVLGLTLGLAAALIFGLSAFQKGSDRAKCLMNISNVQKAVRSWANLNEIAPGTTVAANLFPGGAGGAPYGRLWGTPQSFLGSRPMCPRNPQVLAQNAATLTQTGAPIGYAHNWNRNAQGGGNNQNTIPEVGFPYINCTLAGYGATPPAGETFHQPCEIDGVPSAGAGTVPTCQR